VVGSTREHTSSGAPIHDAKDSQVAKQTGALTYIS
jgi:hypothetical protein